MHETKNDAAKYLRLKDDGDKAVVVFLGEPFAREVWFDGDKYVTISSKFNMKDVDFSLRVSLNVALYDTMQVAVWEMSSRTFRDVLKLRDKFGLDRWAFEIQRHGAAKDQKTTYSILPEHELDVEQRREFGGLRLYDLGRMYEANLEVEDEK